MHCIVFSVIYVREEIILNLDLNFEYIIFSFNLLQFLLNLHFNELWSFHFYFKAFRI